MRKRVHLGLTVLSLAVLSLSLAACGGGIISPAIFFIERVSVGFFGLESNGSSNTPAITSDGRYIAYRSAASNLLTGFDGNGQPDIFVYDRLADATIRVSISSLGTEANSGSNNPSISPNGRYVAFQSGASNLVAGDSNGFDDVFAHDWQSGATIRASVDSSGTQANNGSYDPSISSDGRYVAFWSFASNLVAADANGAFDVFVRDTLASATTRVSVGPGGVEANGLSINPSISSNGRYVAFQSSATNLVAGDANGADDIFVRDTVGGTTTRVSVATGGAEANGASNNPSVSSDGRYVVFRSSATNLVAGDANGVDDIFIRDTVGGTTTRASVDSAGVEANGASNNPSISSDGRYVSFQSSATNLAAGDTNGVDDIFVRDTVAGTTTRRSVNSAAGQANGASINPAISSNGLYVVFESSATNLVNGDINLADDIFFALR